MQTRKNFILAACAALGLLAALPGCAPTVAERGNMLKDYQIADVKPGVDTDHDVLLKLGSPTTRAPFDEKTWYYFGQETAKHGIFDPKITKERIVVVTFNDQNVVNTIQDVPSDRLDLPIARDKTPTSGSEMTVLQQFMGNMGRFNKEKKDNPADIGGGANPSH